MKSRIYHAVASMLCDGYSRREIAELLNMPLRNVHNHIKYARSIGVEARFNRDRVLLASAPPHMEQWLRRQAPEGATAGDVILAILNDAYNEDMEKNRPTGQKEE